MNLSYFIARRLSADKQKTFSKLIVRIAIASVAVSLAVMIVSLAIVTGFQKEISDKVIGFGTHIQISKLSSNTSFETEPILLNRTYAEQIKQLPEVRHIQAFATKAGIIKTKDDIEGIVVKGVDSHFDWSFFQDKLVDGELFRVSADSTTQQVLISRTTSQRLRLNIGDKLVVYFIQKKQKLARVFRISGIYESGLEEFDKTFMIADIGHIQKLNRWESDQASGFEILLHDLNNLAPLTRQINEMVDIDLKAISIKERYPQLFDWVDMLDINTQIIIILMAVVACINMITALLVLILERTNMIGIMKALGTEGQTLRNTFIYMAGYLTIRGLFWGNLIGIGLCLAQLKWSLITLSQESYYMSVVPINLEVQHLLLINIGSFVAITLAMLIPSAVINRIPVLRAIKLD